MNTSINENQKYETPKIDIIKIDVEKGFAASGANKPFAPGD